jgi:hypothetical protein
VVVSAFAFQTSFITLSEWMNLVTRITLYSLAKLSARCVTIRDGWGWVGGAPMKHGSRGIVLINIYFRQELGYKRTCGSLCESCNIHDGPVKIIFTQSAAPSPQSGSADEWNFLSSRIFLTPVHGEKKKRISRRKNTRIGSPIWNL